MELDINSKDTHEERADELIGLLQTRGRNAFSVFCEILQETYPDLADLLQEESETGPSLFIIHAGEDKKSFVRPLHKALLGQNLREEEIFFDEVSISAGENISEKIMSTLASESLKLVTIVMSNHLLDKYWPRLEYELSLFHQKKFYPIWLDQNTDNFEAFGKKVGNRFPMLKKTLAHRIQYDSIAEEITDVAVEIGQLLLDQCHPDYVTEDMPGDVTNTDVLWVIPELKARLELIINSHDLTPEAAERIAEIERTLFTPKLLSDPQKYSEVFKTFLGHSAVILKTNVGSLLLILSFFRIGDVDKFYHTYSRTEPGSLSTELSKVLVSKHFASIIGERHFEELSVRVHVEHADYLAIRNRLKKGLVRSTCLERLQYNMKPKKMTHTGHSNYCKSIDALNLASSPHGKMFNGWESDMTKLLQQSAQKKRQLMATLEIAKNQASEIEDECLGLKGQVRYLTDMSEKKDSLNDQLLKTKEQMTIKSKENQECIESLENDKKTMQELTGTLQAHILKLENRQALLENDKKSMQERTEVLQSKILKLENRLSLEEDTEEPARKSPSVDSTSPAAPSSSTPMPNNGSSRDQKERVKKENVNFETTTNIVSKSKTMPAPTPRRSKRNLRKSQLIPLVTPFRKLLQKISLSMENEDLEDYIDANKIEVNLQRDHVTLDLVGRDDDMNTLLEKINADLRDHVKVTSVENIHLKIMREFGYPLIDCEPESLYETIRSYSGPEAVLILDNADGLLEKRDTRDEFLKTLANFEKQENDQIQIFVTTRVHLIDDEQESPFTNLILCQLDVVREGGVELVRKLAGRDVISPDDAKILADRCGNWPLAIKVVCSQLRDGTVKPGDMLNRLQTLQNIKEIREFMLQAYDSLSSERLRQVLMQISVFAGPFTKEAAKEVLDSGREVGLLLRELKMRNLIRMVHEEGHVRFWLDPDDPESDSAHQVSVGVLLEQMLTVDERIRFYSRMNAAKEQKDSGERPPEPADIPGDTLGRESRHTGDQGSYGHLTERGTEARLYQISKVVSEEWTRLGQELGLEKSVLDNIVGVDNTQKTLQMLTAWRIKTPHGPLHYLPQLEETLQNIGRQDLAATVQEAYKEYRNGVQLTELSPDLDKDKKWSLHLPGEGKYLCRRTGLGVVTPYPLDVTYRSANWSDCSWPLEGEDLMPVGPLFSIKCEDVEGPVDLLLPHVLADTTEVTRQDLHVVHVVGNSPELLPVTELTSSHAVTRFKKGSDFGLAGKKEKVRSVSRKGLFTAFRSLESSGISILNVYIVSNDRTVQATIEQDETKWHSSHCHTTPCQLYQGRKYYLKGEVTNGGDVSVSIKPEYLIFEDTLDNNKFYAPFRVEVSQDIWSSNASRLHLELQEETNNDERKPISEVMLDDADDYFGDVVDAVSNKWDDLARKLGFTRNEIKGIKTSERDNDHRF
uniref:Death domain-containing protein n=1 Tax=Branchiostoma floridae TaxID=7739 RepID=C3YWB3_BRAFL|eukprot:XP_002599430.1 hypothetical protein BRAFLDRAFT_106573 [Branchiostoma floridae]